MSKQTVIPIPRDQIGTFTLYASDREDGITKVTMEITDDLTPVLGETVTVRVVEVVRESVER